MPESEESQGTESNLPEDPIRDLTPIIQELELSAEQTTPRIQFDRDDNAGPDFHVLKANSSGLYCMAAALLRLAQKKETSDPAIDEYLTDLTDGNSEIFLGSLVRFDGDSSGDETSMGEASSCWGGIGCALLLISIPVFWIIGLFSFFFWLFG